MAAALAVKESLQSSGATGTVRYYGTPAEEGGSGTVDPRPHTTCGDQFDEGTFFPFGPNNAGNAPRRKTGDSREGPDRR